jgi:Tfp pilus assembly protein PilO
VKAESSTRTIVAILVVVAAAVAFWILLISPKMKEKDDLGSQAEELRTALSQTQSEVAAAEEAKRRFPKNYRQLVLLGKAVPVGDDTPSLIVQMNTIAEKSHNGFDSIQFATQAGAAEPAAASSSGESVPATPTEASAALLPLGASVGSAGLGVMPYELLFTGSFFHVADFIKGIDSMVESKGSTVSVDGRLLTINGFSLAESHSGFPNLEAHFSVTAYVAPPGQGLTGTTEVAPAEGEVAEGVEEEAVETAEGTAAASVAEAK